jgi:hypothetical protein
VRDATPDLLGGRCLSASRAASKSHEIDSTSSAGDSIPRKISVPDRGVHAPALAALYDVSDPGKYRASHRLSPVFCPDWAFAGRETPAAASPARDEPRSLTL